MHSNWSRQADYRHGVTHIGQIRCILFRSNGSIEEERQCLWAVRMQVSESTHASGLRLRDRSSLP
jgi:hypothetical protein